MVRWWGHSSAISLSVAFLVLLAEAPIENPPKASVIPKDGCGRSPVNEKARNSQVTDRHDALLGSWPWQVSLQIYKVALGGYRHQCGGSLITNNSVLTAAHCIEKWVNPEYWRVVIGLHHLYKWQSHTENHRVKDIVVHSEFKSGHYENDIALFKLIRSVKYSEYIQPICLPDIVLLMSDDNPCYISGWERSKTKDLFKFALQEAQVDVIPLYICDRYEMYEGRLSKNMVCAGSERRQANICKNHGGSLMCYFPEVSRYYLIGITSSILDCDQLQYPGVYLRTANYRHWIDTHISDKAATANIQCVLVFLTVEWIIFHFLL